MRRAPAFSEWLGIVECRRPEMVFVGIKGVRDIMVGDVHDYEPWLRDGGVQVCGYLPTQSRPRIEHDP